MTLNNITIGIGAIIGVFTAVILLVLLGDIIREETVERLQHNPTYRNAALVTTIFILPAVLLSIVIDSGQVGEIVVGVYIGLVVFTVIGYTFFEKDDSRPDIHPHGNK